MSLRAGKARGERAFFFDVGEERIFGFLHLPTGAPAGAVVLCHAFAEEKLWSHRVYVTFAREAAQAGFAVLRFDMRGEGDSDRDFEQSDVATRIADTVRAIEVARELTGAAQVTLLGHRLGGSIALAAAARAAEQVRQVIVWDPIVDGADYFGTLLRSNMATQMATAGKVTRTRDALIEAMKGGEVVVADGYGLTAALYEGVAALQWGQHPEFFSRPVLALEVPRGEQQQPSAALVELLRAHPQSRALLAPEPPFWRETRQFHRRMAHFTAASLDALRGTL